MSETIYIHHPSLSGGSLAPGDFLILSGAIREVQAQHPNRFSLYLECPRPELFEGVTGVTAVTRLPQKTDVRRVVVGSVINNGNDGIHYHTALTKKLAERLKIKCSIRDIRPRVVLNDHQKTRPMQNKYWVIVSGGKKDMPVKVWPKGHWDKLISSLPMQFVQLGKDELLHPPIQKSINMVGKTDLLEMIRWIAHSNGVICGISLPMVIAAALNKPCVVIAGGREPPHWVGYTKENWEKNTGLNIPEDFIEHRFITTVGSDLQCCKYAACWKKDIVAKPDIYGNINTCIRPVYMDDEIKYRPECMVNILPENVAKYILEEENKHGRKVN